MADLLLRCVRPVPALLDRDVSTAVSSALLRATAARTAGREGAWYDAHIKPHEYGGMTAAARQIRAAGCPVLLDAPFTQQIRDLSRWRAWVAELGGAPVHVVWVRSDAETLRERLIARGRAQDAGKLADFAAFTARVRPTEPPQRPVAVDNPGGPRWPSGSTPGPRPGLHAGGQRDRQI